MTLCELLGADTETEAIDHLLAERAAMVEWKGEIDTLKIVVRRLVVVVEISRRVSLALASEMFIDKKIRDLIGKILEQCTQLEDYIDFTKGLK